MLDRATDEEFHRFVFRDGRLIGHILVGDASLAAAVKRAIEGAADLSALPAKRANAADVLAHLA